MAEYFQELHNKPYDKDWRKNPIWLNIKPITLKNCIDGTGPVEKIESNSSQSNAKEQPKQKVFKFGKFKGKTYAEVEKFAPSYIEWCRENIANFDG